MTVLPFQTDEEVTGALSIVTHHLAQGKLLAYPTETVYGLGSRPVEHDVASLARLKGRPARKPFLLLVAGLDMVQRYGLEFTAAAELMARTFWPGPLTLVLFGAVGKLPDALRGPEGGVAVRWTSHPGVARLIEYLDFPLTSTSANRPGGPPAPGVGAILDAFRAEVDGGRLLVLDGGVLGHVPSSTLVDCTQATPRLIREGAIPRAELQARIGSLAP